MKKLYGFFLILYAFILLPNYVEAAPQITRDDTTKSNYYKTNVKSDGTPDDFYSTNFFSAYLDLSGKWAAETGVSAELNTQVYSAKDNNRSGSPYVYFWGKSGRLSNDTVQGYWFVKKSAINNSNKLDTVPISAYDSAGREFKGFYLVSDKQANQQVPDKQVAKESNLPNASTYRTAKPNGELVFGGKSGAINKASAAYWVYSTYDYVINMNGMTAVPATTPLSGTVRYTTEFKVPKINISSSWTPYYAITYSSGAAIGEQAFNNNQLTVSSNSGSKFSKCIKNSDKIITFTANAYSTLGFNLNKPSNMSANPTITETSRTIYYNAGTAAFPTIPSATGWSNSGWKVDNVAASTAAASVNTYGGKTATTTWTANTYYVKYHPNTPTGMTHSGAMGDSTHTYDSGKALSSVVFSVPGYEFKGWSTTATGSVSYTNGQSVKNLTATNGATVNLYAVWEPIKYKVVYKANGGTGNDVTEEWTYNQARSLYNNTPNLPNTFVSGQTPHFTKQGYYISGWTPSIKNGTTAVTSSVTHYDTGTGYTVSGSTYTAKSATKTVTNLCTPTSSSFVVTMSAIWSPIKYHVSYLNDDTTPSSSVDRKYIFYSPTINDYGLDFATDYELEVPVTTRENKYGKSTWLGYSRTKGDLSRNPKWAVKGYSPDKWVSQKPTKLNTSNMTDMTTSSGTSYSNYFKYLNAGNVQTFNIYSIYDDCPGFEPIDLQWVARDNEPKSITTRFKTAHNSTRSKTAAEYDILTELKSNVWDREGDASSITSDMKEKYYIKDFESIGLDDLTKLSNSNTDYVPVTFRLNYVVKDTGGNTYETSRKLYVGAGLVDIKVGGSQLIEP